MVPGQPAHQRKRAPSGKQVQLRVTLGPLSHFLQTHESLTASEHTAHWPARPAVGNSQARTDNHRWLPTDGATRLDFHTYNS